MTSNLRCRRSEKVQTFYATHHACNEKSARSHVGVTHQFTAFIGWVGRRSHSCLLRLLCGLRLLKDLDTIHECLDCKEAFSLWQWRHTCAGCANSFCKKCLERRHIVDTSVPPVPPLPKVCAFCYFTHCARLCGCRCCRDVPVREVKRFLSRKGIPTNHAVEKQELLDSIHYWALDLAAASDFVAGEDLEARMRIQDAECSTDRDTAPYRHHCHVDDGTLLHSLPIVELRRRLDALGVQHESCIEKDELIRKLLSFGWKKMNELPGSVPVEVSDWPDREIERSLGDSARTV